MNNAYEPDDRFVERLEWQLSSEYRRTNRLKSAPGKITVSRRMAGVAAIVGLVLTGLTALNAAAYLKDRLTSRPPKRWPDGRIICFP
jgi:hypothetical protein